MPKIGELRGQDVQLRAVDKGADEGMRLPKASHLLAGRQVRDEQIRILAFGLESTGAMVIDQQRPAVEDDLACSPCRWEN